MQRIIAVHKPLHTLCATPGLGLCMCDTLGASQRPFYGTQFEVKWEGCTSTNKNCRCAKCLASAEWHASSAGKYECNCPGYRRMT